MIASAAETRRVRSSSSSLADLVTALSGLDDSPSIGDALARSLATRAGLTALVAIRTHQGDFDVWLASPNAAVRREKWDRHDAGLEPFLALPQAVIFDKLAQPASDLLRQQLWLLPRQSLMAVSLPAGATAANDLAPGCLVLIDPEPGGFTPGDMDETAKLATVFLDRAALRQRVSRQQTEFSAVAGISQTLAGSLDLSTIFDQLNGPIRSTLDVETLSVGMVEPASGDIIFVNELMGPEFADLPTVRVKKGQGIAGWVAEHKEPVIINDTYADKRFFSGVDSKSGFRTSSMICIPLQVEEQTVGVLQAINRRSGQFTESDLAVLQATGGPLAAAIVNANLNRDRAAAERRTDTILTTFSEAVVIVNREHLIVRASESFGVLAGHSPAVLVGQPIDSLVTLEGAPVSQLVDRAFAAEDGRSERLDKLTRRQLPDLPVLVQCAVVESEASGTTGPETVILFSDLTLSAELERMRDDLFESIIGELRTPLATILMYARLLRNGRATTEVKADRFLGVIERESDRLQRLIRQMLDLSRLEAREFRRSAQAMRFEPQLRRLAAAASDRAVAKGLMFRTEIESDLPAVLGTSELLESVFGSLLDNAIKYTPTGTVELRACVEDDSVVVEIKDDGIGIPLEAQPHVFKRFYRTNLAVERGVAGTGLGLYLVKESLRSMGGSITVHSEPGEGATFTVRLPVAEE